MHFGTDQPHNKQRPALTLQMVEYEAERGLSEPSGKATGPLYFTDAVSAYSS